MVAAGVVPTLFNPRGQMAFDVVKAGLVQVLGLLSGLVALLAAVAERRAVRPHPILAAAAAVVGVYAAATAFGVAPGLSFYGGGIRSEGLLALLAFGAIAFCVSTLDVADTDAVLIAAIAGSIGPAVYAIAQVASGNFRPGATLGNPILFGGYLAAVIPMTAAVAAVTRRAAVWWIVALQVAALAATRAKGASIALTLAVLVAAASTIDFTDRRRRITMAIGAICVGIAAAGCAALVYHRYGTLIVGRTLQVRVLIWRDVGRLVSAQGRRLALGYGPEMLQSMIAPFYTPDIALYEGTFAVPDRAHNDVLDTLVGAGVAGAVAVAALHTILIVTLVAMIRRSRSAGAFRAQLVAVGLLASAVAHLVDIQTGVANISSRLIWWCCVGIAAARSRSDAPSDRLEEGGATDGVWLSGAASAAAIVFALWRPNEGLSGGALAVVSAIALVIGCVGFSLRDRSAGARAYARSAAIAAALPIAMVVGLTAWDGQRGAASAAASDPSATRWTVHQATACLAFFTLVAVTISVTRSWKHSGPFGARRVAALAGAGCVAVMLVASASRQSRADILAAIGEQRAALGRWVDASRVEEERVAVVPESDRAWAALGGVYLEIAQRAADGERSAWFRRAADALAEAGRRNPYEWLHLRNRASVERVWAAADRAGRAEHLAEADRYFREASERAPAFPRLWAEWGNVDAERGDLRAAFQKLDRATAMNGGFDAKQVSDAIFRALGTDLVDPASRRRAADELDRQGFHALAALYVSR